MNFFLGLSTMIILNVLCIIYFVLNLKKIFLSLYIVIGDFLLQMQIIYWRLFNIVSDQRLKYFFRIWGINSFDVMYNASSIPYLCEYDTQNDKYIYNFIFIQTS